MPPCPNRSPRHRLPANILAAAAALTLGACSTLRADDAPKCSGPRRPANPHGSVLSPAMSPPAATTAPKTGGCGGRS